MLTITTTSGKTSSFPPQNRCVLSSRKLTMRCRTLLNVRILTFRLKFCSSEENRKKKRRKKEKSFSKQVLNTIRQAKKGSEEQVVKGVRTKNEFSSNTSEAGLVRQSVGPIDDDYSKRKLKGNKAMQRSKMNSVLLCSLGRGEAGNVYQKLCLLEKYWERGNMTFKDQSSLSQICSSFSKESLDLQAKLI